jgi:putative ABC transport system permease protein
LQIIEGKDLAEEDGRGILLGQGLARNLGARVDETVVLMATSASGGTNAVECRVRGLFATASKAFDDVALRAPLVTTRSLLKTSGSHAWIVFLDRTESTAPVLNELREELAAEPVELVPWNDLADMFNKTVALFGRQIGVMKIIVAMIIVLSITNTMTMSVIERTGEIGTSMALGLRRRGLVRMFLLEGLLLGLIGGGFGLALGGTAAWLISLIGIPMPPPPGMERGYTAQITVSATLAWDAFVLAMGTSLAASVYPAWKASRMAIVDALRHNR